MRNLGEFDHSTINDLTEENVPVSSAQAALMMMYEFKRNFLFTSSNNTIYYRSHDVPFCLLSFNSSS